ncbi:hypothetical protein [uncultured Bacteroides sp.]|jgi:hypothetical protein|uniref:hypothetical protein n=1 Tax=uncultured Bacteroides sp. TaxID=162156 RepID=UPI0025FBFA37|nr:hypothetical protein [uncultured Bacteroides sp.]
MKKNLVYMLGVIGCSSMLMTSCIAEDLGVGNIQQQIESNGEWNKNRTFELYFLSSLKNEAVFNADAAVNYINNLGDACSLCLVDRMDVKNSSYMANEATDVAMKTSRFSSYAMNKYNAEGWDKKFEGSLILFNHKINSEEGFKVTKDCFVKFIPIMVKTTTDNPMNILVPFSTVRFETKEQIDAASATFSKVFDNQHSAIMVGTVKKEAIEDLKKATEKIEGCIYTEVLKNQETDYHMFMISNPTWVLREVRSTNVADDLNAYQLSIEFGVH